MPLNASRSFLADKTSDYRGVSLLHKGSKSSAKIKHVSKPRSWSKTKQLRSHCLSSRRSAALHKQEKCCLVISKRSATPKVSCHLRAHKSYHLGVPLCQNKSTPCNQFHTLQLTHLHRGVTRSTSALLPARWLPLWHGMRLLSHWGAKKLTKTFPVGLCSLFARHCLMWLTEGNDWLTSNWNGSNWCVLSDMVSTGPSGLACLSTHDLITPVILKKRHASNKTLPLSMKENGGGHHLLSFQVHDGCDWS
jgi:hypothetical protein